MKNILFMFYNNLYDFLCRYQHEGEAEECQWKVDWTRPGVGSESRIITTKKE